MPVCAWRERRREGDIVRGGKVGPPRTGLLSNPYFFFPLPKGGSARDHLPARGGRLLGRWTTDPHRARRDLPPACASSLRRFRPRIYLGRGAEWTPGPNLIAVARCSRSRRSPGLGKPRSTRSGVIFSGRCKRMIASAQTGEGAFVAYFLRSAAFAAWSSGTRARLVLTGLGARAASGG